MRKRCAQFDFKMRTVRNIIAFLICTSAFFSCGQVDKKFNATRDNADICYITDSITYSIINQIISDFNHEEIHPKFCKHVILNKNILPMLLDDYRRFLYEASELGFDLSDSTYILNQINKEIKCVYDPRYIQATVVPSDTLDNWMRDYKKYNMWEKFREKYKSGILIIDVPIFNRSKDMAIINISYSIGGTWGFDELWIYKLVKDKWIKYKLIDKIVS
jgi:hypothetical protein